MVLKIQTSLVEPLLLLSDFAVYKISIGNRFNKCQCASITTQFP